ncbi:MAG TPA: DsbA family protein [Acidimicrobiales bacterium]|jgi:predicted DsbA family dithiol-disulfide isomerase|nr:DsbA family protein [Acidimicrobiales bacterium]
MTVTFFFDPSCPWTWVTSRWLQATAAREHFDVEWRSFSLPYEHEDREHPDVVAAHRVIEALRRTGDNDGVKRFYDALGRRWYDEGEAHTTDVVRVAMHDAGLDSFTPALHDESLDAGVAASTEQAMALAGPDIGSPVLELEDGRSLFGPILHAVPDDEGCARVWEAVLLLAGVPEYHELKRGRRRQPDTKAS